MFSSSVCVELASDFMNFPIASIFTVEGARKFKRRRTL